MINSMKNGKKQKLNNTKPIWENKSLFKFSK